MTIQDILNDIDSEKQKAITELEAEFTAKLAELDSLHEKNKESLKEEYKVKVEEKKASIEKKTEAQTNMEKKILMLTAKRGSLNEAFTEAAKALANSKDYENILANLLSDVELEDAEVVVAKGKKPETVNALKKAKKNYKITAEGDFAGGAIIIGKDVEIDLSFGTLVDDLRTELETDIAYKLFN